ncbi:MAG: family 78 glycoside hydrolase catalytic domain [Fimbriimonadaceae bacterium]|nr:family 78 glycoside hydrolase catalytic domain [Fimbriimonadaceae bacterium]
MTFSLVLATIVTGAVVAVPLVPAKLRCDWKVNPLAVDDVSPRLTWVAEGKGSDRLVTAHQVLVSSTRAALDQDRGDLWDTGKQSGDSFSASYQGRDLAPGQEVFWKVRVWDENDKPGSWSAVSTWRNGIARDWRAGWVQDPKAALPPEPPSMDGASWYGHPDDSAESTAKGYVRHYRVPFSDRAVTLLIAADDHFKATVDGNAVVSGGFTRFEVIRLPERPTSRVLDVTVTNDQGMSGLLVKFLDKDGDSVEPGQIQVAQDQAGPWTPAKKLVDYGGAPWGRVKAHVEYPMGPAAMFRRAFQIEKPVRSALLYATALGAYQVSVNGRAVAGTGLAPGWTEFTKRAYYHTHDVTKSLKQGENVLGSWLGDGWYAGYLAFTGRRFYYGGAPALSLELRITYADGATDRIVTGPDWQVAHGENLHNDLLMGCATDYRLARPGWDRPGFRADGWSSVKVVDPPKISLSAHPNSEVDPQMSITAKTRTESAPGVWVYDFGQNFSGVVRFKVKGKAGDVVTVRHGERLDKGKLYTANLRAAKATDTYVLAKDGVTVCEPKFTFHGFQYCEISGVATPPGPGDVEGIVLHSDLPLAGTFKSSEPLLDRLVLNSDWSQLGNYLDVPTDCPQRDERAGWTGDAQVYIKSAYFNRDIAAFADKWLVDLCEDSPSPVDGAFPDVAPYLNMVGRGNAGWDDAGVVCVYQTWRMTGDTRPVVAHWAALDKCCDYWAAKAKDYIRPPGAYGDWLLLDGLQHSESIATALWVRDLRYMEEMAEAVGKDSAKYAEQRAKVRAAWRAAFWKDGKINDKGPGDQSMYAVAVMTGVLDDKEAQEAADVLADMVRARGGHLSTGFLGTPEVLKALADHGHADVAYGAVLKKDYPSWLYQIKLGATSMWERWDGWTPEKGFQDAGMNSFNHYWLGCVNEWLYTYAAGIDLLQPGWAAVSYKPYFTDQLGHVDASYESVRGTVKSSWRRMPDGSYEARLHLPVGVRAVVELPAGTRPASSRTVLSHGVGTVGSGDHLFLVPKP